MIRSFWHLHQVFMPSNSWWLLLRATDFMMDLAKTADHLTRPRTPHQPLFSQPWWIWHPDLLYHVRHSARHEVERKKRLGSTKGKAWRESRRAYCPCGRPSEVSHSSAVVWGEWWWVLCACVFSSLLPTSFCKACYCISLKVVFLHGYCYDSHHTVRLGPVPASLGDSKSWIFRLFYASYQRYGIKARRM